MGEKCFDSSPHAKHTLTDMKVLMYLKPCIRSLLVCCKDENCLKNLLCFQAVMLFLLDVLND